MITIRKYRKSDWHMIDGWWKESGEIGPIPSMYPEESSFVAEIDGVPCLAVALYLTNTPALCYAENFIGKPGSQGSARKHAAMLLSDHIAKVAKALGYERIMAMSDKEVLANRYFELGFDPTLSGVTTLVRRL